MNINDMNKDQLIEKIEEIEQKNEELTTDNESLESQADDHSDYIHELNDEKKSEYIFYMGAKSGINKENTLKAWLTFKMELGL